MKAGIAAVIFATSVSSCSVSQLENIASSVGGRTPEGEIKERTYDFKDIQAIEAYSGVKVYYTQNPSATSVVVKAPADVLEVADIKMDGTTLSVSLKSGSNFRYKSDSQRLQAYVNAPAVKYFAAYAGADIAAEAPVNIYDTLAVEAHSGSTVSFADLAAPKAIATASSGATINFALLKCENADIEASAGASIGVEGESSRAEIGASAGASVNASKFFVQKGKINAYAGASVRAAVRDAKVDCSGGATVSNNSKF